MLPNTKPGNYAWNSRETENVNPSNLFLKKVSDIIISHLSDPGFNSSLLARKLGLSRSYLSRKLSRLSGKSPGKLIYLSRLVYAERLIIEEQYAIKTVALTCGYSDTAGFSKAFQRHFGLTPTEAGRKKETNECNWSVPLNPNLKVILASQIQKDRWLQKLLHLLIEEVESGEKTSLKEIAGKMYQSTSQLNRILKKNWG
ncbi:MAG TPA: hypothetical protein DDW81_16925 [Cryomorphaceae bacterium]|nr:hypothetical protein [Owenweeksia sp.]HBF21786.1 hypothetical protein [Cryomorphaceae bacterium]HCQ15941.1 hypothetical protein [Cryomorphaceae bacterium]|tara:strand:+ start:1288 stop:1887 length:600 start_codon:yes stop_codon:yes gene_type:complete